MSLVLFPKVFTMFWNNHAISTPKVDSVLKKESFTLTEILDKDDVIQEANNLNRDLLEYLTSTEILTELIRLIIREPSSELPENLRYKHAHVASELLSSKTWLFSQKIASDENLMNELYSFLETEDENETSSLNPLLASFFSKAFCVLVTRQSEQNWYNYQVMCVKVFEFLTKKNFIIHFLKHIGTSAISDLALKLITSVEVVNWKFNLLTWFYDKKLIQSVIGLLDPHRDRDVHDNAARFLIELLRIYRGNRFVSASERYIDPIQPTLESPEFINLILDRIFESKKNESIIINGISILLEFIEPKDFSESYTVKSFNQYPAEMEIQQKSLDSAIDVIVSKLSDFTALLLDPPSKTPLVTSSGVLDPPLGSTRLSVAQFVSSLLATNHVSVNIELTTHNTIDILLDLFFKYSYNNFLHHHVERCIVNIFNWKTVEYKDDKDDNLLDLYGEYDPNEDKKTLSKSINTETKENENDDKQRIVDNYENPLLVHLYSNCRLVERVLDAWEENETEKSLPGSHRKGYMGHLTKIANVMNDVSDDAECKNLIMEQMKKLPGTTVANWTSFVATKLSLENERNVLTPVTSSNYQRRCNSGADERDVQQLYTDYQIQPMSFECTNDFGVMDDELGESEDTHCSLNKLSNFSLEESIQGQNNFENICEERLKKIRRHWSDETQDSSSLFHGEEEDEEEEEESYAVKMELDPSNPWEESSPDMDFGCNPWKESCKSQKKGGGEEEEEEEESWAKFEDDKSESMEEDSVLNEPSNSSEPTEEQQQQPIVTTKSSSVEGTNVSS